MQELHRVNMTVYVSIAREYTWVCLIYYDRYGFECLMQYIARGYSKS